MHTIHHMTDFKPYKPPRPKPRPGSRPLKDRQRSDDDGLQKLSPELRTSIEAIRKAVPPWEEGNDAPIPPPDERKRQSNFTKLKAARKKVEELAQAVRSDAFDDWVSCCVVTAKEPSEWTQARILYESYLRHAKSYGRNRGQRAESVQELATETQWGRMMATLFPKKRRRAGFYYQLRLRRGA
ncbi:hypothetical protein ACM7JP_17870 [Pseudomonas aeruginosa]